MLHMIGLMFFSSLMLTSGLAIAAMLYRSRREIAQALGAIPAPAPVMTPGVARVRVRYVSQARRVTPQFRAAA